MNPYVQPSNTARNTLINSPLNVGVRPMLGVSNPETTPARIQQPQPNERNITYNTINYQQHQSQSDMHQNRAPNQQIFSQQQSNTLQNHPYSQQPNRQNPEILLRQDSAKLQPQVTHITNVPNRFAQGGGIPLEIQRTQMTAQVRFPNTGESTRPPLSNTNSVAFISQAPNNNADMSKTLNNRIRPNFPNVNPEDHKNQVFRGDPSNLAKKSSVMDTYSFDGTDPQTKPDETTSSNTSVRLPQESTTNAVKSDTEKKPNLTNAQAIPSPETKTGQNQLISEKNEYKGNTENREVKKMDSLSKMNEKNQKEDKKSNAKDGNIASGVVRKNIKFFEENDTAKKPLTPTAVTVQKREKVANVPSDIIRGEFHKNDYESGVDETPVVHPNLGSTSQIPRKVAKIPRLRRNKHIQRNRSEKMHKFKSSSQIFKCSHHTSGKKAFQKVKVFGSNEELLAFFESTKSWRKINRYGKSATNQNATKDKVVHKPTTNGDISPKKTPLKLPAASKTNPPVSPTKVPLKSPGTPGAKSLPKTPDSTAPSTPLIKKVPMNKIQVGAAPSPNLKTVRSKVGSLANSAHKPGGGNIKIETRKIDLSKAQPRIEAKNDQYKPSGGDKKIEQVKLQWSAKSKVGSLENSTYKPGGGDKKIESVKLDFKEKAKPKVGSKDNVKHVPGGGNIKIENQKLEFKAQSKVGSLDNVKHKPGGGDIKIFDDKTYLRQVSGNCSEGRASGTQTYKGLSTTGYKESKSNPGTPARKITNVKIKKLITFQSFEETPKIEKTTKVIVTSQMPKEYNKNCKSPVEQKITLTYSKISSEKSEGSKSSVEMIRVPVRSDAPTLKPSLHKKGTLDITETVNQDNQNQSKINDSPTILQKDMHNVKKFDVTAVTSFPDSRSKANDDSEMSKFLKDEIAVQEKIGKIWQEMNNHK